tara:strand:+ start:937 stop:1053 length:117 start_codon:yes stop_codon:yes gene_type:complete
LEFSIFAPVVVLVVQFLDFLLKTKKPPVFEQEVDKRDM